MAKNIKVTLKRSVIGHPQKHREVIKGLGLKKLNKSKVLQDTPSIRGMIQKVSHMLKVEEII